MEGSERRYVDNTIQFQGFGQRVNGLATAKEAYTARFLGHPLPVQMLSRSDARTEVFSKININGAGGLRTYLGFTHSAFS